MIPRTTTAAAKRKITKTVAFCITMIMMILTLAPRQCILMSFALSGHGGFRSQPLVRRGAWVWAARRSRSTGGGNDGPSLDWEKFDFGTSPKWDPRFSEPSSSSSTTTTTTDLEELHKQETKEDQRTATRINQQLSQWEQVDPHLVQRATQVLLPYVNQARIHKIQAVLEQRTTHTRFLFENPANPSNVFACLRTLDAFGIQYIDLILNSAKYQGKAALSQKRGMRVAMGSAQWLSIRNHPTTAQAIQSLKQQNFRIYASDVNPNAKDIRDIEWPEDGTTTPICIVMGNEETGISSEMRELADETFYLPMCGFAESFNLSVATAITLAHLSSATKATKGPLRPGLTTHEYNCLFLKGLMHSLPNKRLGDALLRKENIQLPPVNTV